VRGIGALLERSLRVDARQIPLHLQRLLVMGLVYVFAVNMTGQFVLFGAPGLQFFRCIAYANAALILLFGVHQFASVITEEKEHGTLGLMMLTGLSPVAILLGKTGSRLLQVLLLLAVQIPFSLLAITFGGVTLNQILCAVVALAAFVIGLAGVGLLASVVFRRTSDAGGVTTVVMLMYSFVAPFALGFANDIRQFGLGAWQPLASVVTTLLDGIYHSSLFVRLSEVLSTGFAGSPWCLQVATNFGVGIACFGLGWWLFPLANRDPDQIPPRRWLAVPKSVAGTRRWRTAGRPWSWPLTWHTFHFTAGGWPAIVFKLLVYVTLGVFIAWVSTDRFTRPVQPSEFFAAWAVLVTVALIVETLVQSARMFPDEFKHQTWTNLRLLPRSIGYIAYSKAAGMALSILPGGLFCVTLWLLAYAADNRSWRVLDQPAFWLFVLFLLSVMHLLMWLSTFASQAAMMIRFAIAAAAWTFYGWLLIEVASPMNEDTIVAVFAFSLIAWCVLTQWLAGKQLASDDA
jgi:hypothetical protein